MQPGTTLVIGASGFIGRAVVSALLKKGHRVFGMARHRVDLDRMMTEAPPDRWTPIVMDVTKTQINKDAIDGVLSVVDNVVYAAGSLFPPGGRQGTDALYHTAPAAISERAARLGVRRFVLISALGLQDSKKSAYTQAKMQGEKKLRKHFQDAVILRPSIVFGHGGGFLDRLAKWAAFTPLIALPNMGQTRFAPIDVGSVAQACCTVLSGSTWRGQIIQLYGKESLGLREMLMRELKRRKQQRWLIGMPGGLFWPLVIVNDLFNLNIMSRDQLRMLEYDNLPASQYGDGCKKLGIVPHRL